MKIVIFHSYVCPASGKWRMGILWRLIRSKSFAGDFQPLTSTKNSRFQISFVQDVCSTVMFDYQSVTGRSGFPGSGPIPPFPSILQKVRAAIFVIIYTSSAKGNWWASTLKYSGEIILIFHYSERPTIVIVTRNPNQYSRLRENTKVVIKFTQNIPEYCMCYGFFFLTQTSTNTFCKTV